MGVQYMRKEEGKGGYSMRFPNAFKGVSKMFAAEILKLIATGLTVATGVAGIVSASGVIQSAVNGAEITEELVANNINMGGVIVAGILGVGAMILYIIAYIMNLVGLAQAGRDEENFGSAFGLSIAVLVISIATAVLTGLSIGGNVPENIASTARTVCEVIVMILVVSGIMNLAERLRDEKMISFGEKVSVLILIFVIAAAVATFISIFFGRMAWAQHVEGILDIISGVALFIGYIIYIIYIAKAKKMLREN